MKVKIDFDERWPTLFVSTFEEDREWKTWAKPEHYALDLPDELWERYRAAAEEFHDAEEAVMDSLVASEQWTEKDVKRA